MSKRLSQEEKDRRDEWRRVSALREFYRLNFRNGESDQSFLDWIENTLADMRHASSPPRA